MSNNGSEETTEVETKAENGECEPTPLEKKIIKQVEYYFGDVNLVRDKFLQGHIKEDNGWVTLETMLLFNRLKDLSDDTSVIVQALEKSKSGLVVVSDDKTKIRRSPEKPLPEVTSELLTSIKNKTVYVKGFPLDATLDLIQEFMETYGAIEHVFLRRGANKNFKGSIFAQFAKEEEAKKFVALEEVKHGETTMIRLFKDDYFKMKQEERKQRREESLQEQEEAKKKREDDDKEKFYERITRGALILIKGIPDGVKMEQIKTQFSEYSPVGWVDFTSGQHEAKVRFEKENAAKDCLDKIKATDDGKVKIQDTEVEVSLIEGDDEVAYWKDMFRQNKERSQNRRGGGRGGRGFGRGGRGGRHGQRSRPGGNKRHKDNEHTGNDEPSSKKEKKE